MSTTLLNISHVADRPMRHVNRLAVAALAVICAVAAAPASATVFNLGSLNINDNVQKSHAFNTVVKKTTLFSDEYDFSVLAPANLIDSDAHNFNSHANQNILGLHLDLKDGVVSIATSGFGTGGANDDVHIPTTAVLPGHHYSLFVTGSIPKGDSAAYDVNLITSGVPELSTWAMMIIGFGGVSLQMRRRHSIAATA